MISHLPFSRWDLPGSIQPYSPRLLAKRLLNRLTNLPPTLWFGLIFAILLAAFVAVLLFEPTVGRGGR